MTRLQERRTDDGFRRLIAFCDAVVAIALTLLVLPLADIVPDLDHGETVWQIFAENRSALGSFLLSFAVIWVLWRHHHRIMEYYRSYDQMLFVLNFVWLLTIVLLPFATAVIDDHRVERGNVFYVAVLAVSMIALSAINWWGMRHRDLLDEGAEIDQRVEQGADFMSAVAVVAALVVTIIVPDSGEWPLLLLLLASPIEHVIRRRRA
jgi:uncharacterized membrane protein